MYICCFYFVAVVNNANMNIHVHVLVWTLHFTDEKTELTAWTPLAQAPLPGGWRI